MPSFLSHRSAQSSPSVTVENGTYRIRRGPLLRNPENFTFPSNNPRPRVQDLSAPEPTVQAESRARSASLISQEKRLVLLVMLLAFATFCCFGTAYYLFTASRLVSVSSRIGVASELVTNLHHQGGTLNTSVSVSNAHFLKPSLATPHLGRVYRILKFDTTKRS